MAKKTATLYYQCNLCCDMWYVNFYNVTVVDLTDSPPIDYQFKMSAAWAFSLPLLYFNWSKFFDDVRVNIFGHEWIVKNTGISTNFVVFIFLLKQTYSRYVYPKYFSSIIRWVQ